MEGLRALDAAAVALLERRLTPELYEPLTSYLRDELGAGVLLMRALLAGFDPGPLAATLLELSTDLADSGYPELSERCLRLRATLADNADGCAAIAAIRRLGTELPSSADASSRMAACAAMFDRYAVQSEAASVAGYSLGNPRLLAEATAEVVDLLAAWGVLGTDRDVLQIGCGAGRFEVALAARVRRAYGIDISPEMIARARRRCAGLPNIHLALGSGTRLDGFSNGSLGLVYAVDSLPYIHQVDPKLIDQVFDEMRRVLSPGGHGAVFNLRYGFSLVSDRAELEALARRHGLDVLVGGIAPFRCWDGRAFLLARPSGG